MKKLLYTLLAVSIIFSACKKEDEEPTNSGNNNTGNNNSNGITFVKQYGFGQGTSVQETTDGGYIITGTNFNNANDIDAGEEGDFYLLKTDGSGVEQWTKNFGEGGGASVQQTTDGGYIITGTTGEWEFFLIKTDGSGNVN